MGRLIFRVFQYEMELDYITVSRSLLVPVSNGLSIKNWFQLIIRIYPGCNITFCCLVYTTLKQLAQVVRDFSFNFTNTCPTTS